ncbi:hypothetical protein [Nocardiopsis synnemataformans]|uniref:hypothetical protein n=1 Tax=Nocardiopsis synnemataformans TaxID=61305 RepID=UPI003EBA2CCB
MTSSSLASVVRDFVRNEAGFTHNEVCRYINQAICDEAAVLWGFREALYPAGTPLDHTTNDIGSSKGSQADGVHHCRLSEEVGTFGQCYDSGRVALAQVLNYVHDQRTLVLAPATSAWIMRLDHDGMMGRQMGVDVASLYERKPEYQRLNESPASQRVPQPPRRVLESGVDYSREAVPMPQHSIGALRWTDDRSTVTPTVLNKATAQHNHDDTIASPAVEVIDAAAAAEHTRPGTLPEQELDESSDVDPSLH